MFVQHRLQIRSTRPSVWCALNTVPTGIRDEVGGEGKQPVSGIMVPRLVEVAPVPGELMRTVNIRRKGIVNHRPEKLRPRREICPRRSRCRLIRSTRIRGGMEVEDKVQELRARRVSRRLEVPLQDVRHRCEIKRVRT